MVENDFIMYNPGDGGGPRGRILPRDVVRRIRGIRDHFMPRDNDLNPHRVTVSFHRENKELTDMVKRLPSPPDEYTFTGNESRSYSKLISDIRILADILNPLEMEAFEHEGQQIRVKKDEEFDPSVLLVNPHKILVWGGLEIARQKLYQKLNDFQNRTNRGYSSLRHTDNCQQHSTALVPIQEVTLSRLVHDDNVGLADATRYVIWALSALSSFRVKSFDKYSSDVKVLNESRLNEIFKKIIDATGEDPWKTVPNFTYIAMVRAGTVLASFGRLDNLRIIDRFIKNRQWKDDQKNIATNATNDLTYALIKLRTKLYNSIFNNKFPDNTQLDVIAESLEINPSPSLFFEFLGIKSPEETLTAARLAKELFNKRRHRAYQLLSDALAEIALDSGYISMEEISDSSLITTNRQNTKLINVSTEIAKIRRQTDQTVSLTPQELPSLGTSGIEALDISRIPGQKNAFQFTFHIKSDNPDERLELRCEFKSGNQNFDWSIIEDPNVDRENVRNLLNTLYHLSFEAAKYINSQNTQTGPTATQIVTSQKGQRRTPEERRTFIRRSSEGKQRDKRINEPTEATGPIYHVVDENIGDLLTKLDNTVQDRVIRALDNFNETGGNRNILPLKTRPDMYRIRVGNYRIILNTSGSQDGVIQLKIVDIRHRKEGYHNL